MKKDKYLLSIIIPVYNVEKYLEQCLESILNQTFDDYEIIIVNDGSTDNSLSICKNYSEKYNKIKLISKENGGVSAARNIGIVKASGKFVMFVDADDFLVDNKCLERIKCNIDDNNDVFMYNMAYCYNDDTQELDYLTKFPIISNPKEILPLLIKNNKLSISPCDKWVKRDILIKNKLFFDVNLQNLEDADWSLKIYSKTNKIQIINEYVYVYRKQRVNSASTNITIRVIENHKKFIENWNKKDFLLLPQKLIQYYLSYQYVILLGMISKNNSYKENRDFIMRYKFLLKTNSCKKVKITHLFSKIFGIHITSLFLEKYLNYRAKGGKLF